MLSSGPHSNRDSKWKTWTYVSLALSEVKHEKFSARGPSLSWKFHWLSLKHQGPNSDVRAALPAQGSTGSEHGIKSRLGVCRHSTQSGHFGLCSWVSTASGFPWRESREAHSQIEDRTVVPALTLYYCAIPLTKVTKEANRYVILHWSKKTNWTWGEKWKGVLSRSLRRWRADRRQDLGGKSSINYRSRRKAVNMRKLENPSSAHRHLEFWVWNSIYT
jgi:hypothetical protein